MLLYLILITIIILYKYNTSNFKLKFNCINITIITESFNVLWTNKIMNTYLQKKKKINLISVYKDTVLFVL